MAITKIKDMVQVIAYILSQEPDRYFDDKELLDLVSAQVESPTPRIGTCIQSLVAGGFANGRFEGGRAKAIRFKDGGPTGTPYTPLSGNAPQPVPHYVSDDPDNGEPNNGMSDAERDRLNAMIEDLQKKADEAFDDLLAKQSEINEKTKEIEDKDKEIENLKSAQKGIRVIEIREKGKKPRKIEDIFHQCFPDICTLIDAKEEIFLYGPTGCGKSHTLGQAANAMKLDFAFTSFSAGTSEGTLVGKQLPMVDEKAMVATYNRLVKQKITPASAATLAAAIGSGFNYLISEYVRVYENGGLFLLDEIDAADANVLLVINASLANGKMAVPNRPDQPYAYRHKDFVAAAAANTIGLGADRMYSGRSRLDDSSMDRFRIGIIQMDYDADVERQLCPDEAICDRLWKIRHNIRTARLERCVSTRFFGKCYKMTSEFGWPVERCLTSLFCGWKDSEIAKATAA